MLGLIWQTVRVRPTNLFSSCIARQQQVLQTRKRIFSTEATSKVTINTSKGTSSIETGTVKIPRKKGFGFSKFILSITLLTGITYGGSVYYSLKNENFRDAFIKYVYGAEKSVEYAEELQRQETFDRFEKNVKNFNHDTIKKGKDVVDKIIQTFKFTSTEEPSNTKVQLPSAKDIEDPILLKLNNTLNELINILNNYNVKDKDDLIKRAQEELKELETHVKLLKIEDQAKTQFLVDEQTKKYDQLYALKEKKTDEFLKMKEHELKQQSEDEKHRLYEQHYEQLKSELARESAKHDEELKNELVRQAVEMQRRWIRDVRFMVEQERGGRLARLDRINHYFKILERISVDNAEHLDNSLKVHKLWCALRSLQDAVEQPHRTPFANQINAMRHLSSTDEVVATVLSTIDDNVANNGIDSISDLSARFAIVREEVRRASLAPENGSVFAHLLSLIFSKVLFRKHGLVKGDDVESILARVQYYLNENDLNTATRELNQLKGWPKKLAEDWIKAARNHLEIKQAIEVIETQATLSSLSAI